MTAAYNDALTKSSGDRGNGLRPDLLKILSSQVTGRADDWCETANDGLDGLSPAEMIKGIKDPGEALEIFKSGAVISDFGFPGCFLFRLAEIGEKVYAGLAELALFPSWTACSYDSENDHGDLLIAAEAMKVLGIAKPEGLFELATAKFIEAEEPEEFIADVYTEFARAYGDSAYLHITEQLNAACSSAEALTPAHEYMMSALCQAENENVMTDPFDCIRRCFRKMDNKMLGAICIGDLGNPRGIRVLKSFLDSGEADDDRELFYQILSSIRKLGGDIADIRDPFRDFV